MTYRYGNLRFCGVYHTTSHIGVARIFDWGGLNPLKFGCLHRNWEWFFSRNQKFERFFRPKPGDLKKKKKKKKKRSSPKLREVFRPKPLALLLLYCLITVMCAITEKKLQLNIVRLCCHNFLSLVEFWLGGARAPWAPPPWLRLWPVSWSWKWLPICSPQSLLTQSVILNKQPTKYCRTYQ